MKQSFTSNEYQTVGVISLIHIGNTDMKYKILIELNKIMKGSYIVSGNGHIQFYWKS